jgi:hypothetical protein
MHTRANAGGYGRRVLREFARSPGAVPASFDPDSFVSVLHGFVYHCIPKTFSRSLLTYLSSVDPSGYRVVEQDEGGDVLETMPTAKRFSFVRNPYSRVVAVYYDKFVNYRETPGQRALFARYAGLRPDMTFPELVDWLSSDAGRDDRVDPHFLSQHYSVLTASGDAAIDYVGRVENGDEDVRQIQGILGLEPRSLEIVNSNAHRSAVPFNTARNWKELLDDGTIRRLTNRYDGDFEFFGYPRLPYRVAPMFSRPTAARSVPSTQRTVRQLAAVSANRMLKPAGLELRARRSRRTPPSP